MKRITAIAVLLLFTSNASAALLMEIENQANFLPIHWNASFGTGRGPNPDGTSNPTLIGLGPCCVGPLLPATTSATPEQLARMQSHFADGNREFYVGLNGAAGWYRVDDLWTTGTITAVYPSHTAARVTPYATPRGSGLSGYLLTEVTTSTAPLFQGGQPYSMQQRTFIYGEVVPEPATWVMVAVAITVFTFTRKRG